MPELPPDQVDFRRHAPTLTIGSRHHVGIQVPTYVHLVVVTKYRHSVFADTMLTRCDAIMRDMCTNFEVARKQYNGEEEHVYVRVPCPTATRRRGR
ncbi:transposase [Streptomyces cadmiisoli]|uniref:Transposase IS200-like domain-containing protein n=1 Tax=Streptomyces cadmiisoli TaxID=2184053 RepID=A0A2Z4JET4_9ACTN|nr:hypothetical protein DN051_42005 [Streptomyces cadmiisoli]